MEPGRESDQALLSGRSLEMRNQEMNSGRLRVLAKRFGRFVPVIRRSLSTIDRFRERAWELRRYCFYRPPGAGEITAILRRMGTGGFSEYALAQKAGHFGRRSFLPDDRAGIVSALRERHSVESARILSAGEKILRGEFDLLGSGPVDMRRSRRSPGSRLDWRRDPISGERYPWVFSNWRWDPYRMRAGNSDVKGPWELTRCQHFSLLGQAYWLSDDRRYAACYADTITDFIRRNPPGFGVHWACTMDVALRVVGWLVGLSYFQNAPELTLRWWRRFLRSLLEHGRFICANLEYGSIDRTVIASNHGVANLLGLYWLAMNFPHLDAGLTWRGIAEGGLEREIVRQFLPDGANFESSVPYHRLTTEMFLSAYALSLHCRSPFSAEYRSRLVRALRFVLTLRQPGGRVPQVGDADNGRAHILTGYGSWNQEEMDHLLVAGSQVLGCYGLAAQVSDEAQVEALFWDVQPECSEHLESIGSCEILEDSGLAVLRGGDTYILMTNGPVGTRGFGNHKHNDQLAVEWAVGRQPLVVDGGSYIYTSDPPSRNLFRSTRSHNTVMVDGEEQNTFNPEWLFRMDAKGKAEILRIEAAPEFEAVEGKHTAYARLDPPMLHARRLLVRSDGCVILMDRFVGSAGHRLRWYFLVYPGVGVDIRNGKVFLNGSRGGGIIDAGGDLSFELERGWFSSGYGKRAETLALVATREDGPESVAVTLIPKGRDGCTREDLLRSASAVLAAGAIGE